MLLIVVEDNGFHLCHNVCHLIKNARNVISVPDDLPDTIAFIWLTDFTEIISTHQTICAKK